MSVCVHTMCICGGWRKTPGILLYGFPPSSLEAGNPVLNIFSEAGFNTRLPTPTLTQVLAAISGFLHECCEFEFRFSRLHKYFYPLSYLPSPQQQLLTPDSQTGLLQMLQLTLKICSLARLFVILIAINNNINNR